MHTTLNRISSFSMNTQKMNQNSGKIATAMMINGTELPARCNSPSSSSNADQMPSSRAGTNA